MFRTRKQQSGGGGAGVTARRALTTVLEKSGLVCGSLKDTVQEKLAENEIDMKWVESNCQTIKMQLGQSMEKPREHILNYAEKACRVVDPTMSPVGSPNTPGVHLKRMSFDDDDNTLDNTVDDTVTSASVTLDASRTRTSTRDDFDDETTMGESSSLHTPPKKLSRFAQILADEKKREEEKKVLEKAMADKIAAQRSAGGGVVVIGLCLSRKNSILGHPDTVTRQMAFDFNQLQDRDYEYVSSTDDGGWLAGGGERGGSPKSSDTSRKIAAPDRVYIPIMVINAANSAVVDEIVAALANGEIFIPEVSILPETLSVNATSPPDLVVRFECEKNDDTPPEEWPNWGLEFLHNQLYDYFAPMGALWSKRPFQITLARKVRWMTIKHMNKYFARSEQVINSWREKGPQYLQPPYAEDSSPGVTLEEITKPHGIYLIRNGVPTNYFAPNFHPPYTTKLTRSLIQNVINKSWDAKHRDWLSKPIPRPKGPVQYVSSFMGCANSESLSPSSVPLPLDGFDLVVDARDVNVSQITDGNEKKTDKKGGEKKQQRQLYVKPTTSSTSIPSFELIDRPDPSGTMEETVTIGSAEDFSSDQILSSRERISSNESDNSVTSSVRRDRKSGREKQQQRPPTTERKDVRDRRQDENVEHSAPPPRVKTPTNGSRRLYPPQTSPSCESMSYSLDSSIQHSHGLHHNFANINMNDGGGSVMTSATESQSLLSYVTRSTMAPSRFQEEDDGREDDVSLSLLESKSTVSVVPDDDKLFAIGWAKALDANSGIYYYFTLDRTKTVWENPLDTST